jgi:hypothetical protein
VVGKLGQHHAVTRVADQHDVCAEAIQGGPDDGHVGVQVARLCRIGPGTGKVECLHPMAFGSQGGGHEQA